MKILPTIFLCCLLLLIASCVSSAPDVQTASTSPQDVVIASPSPPAPVQPVPSNEKSEPSHLPVTGVSKQYDESFAKTIETNWDDMLKRNSRISKLFKTGKVVLQFSLHSDGQVTDMKVVTNDVTGVQVKIAKIAILKGVPYPPWSDAMLKALGKNCRDVQFTFNY